MTSRLRCRRDHVRDTERHRVVGTTTRIAEADVTLTPERWMFQGTHVRHGLDGLAADVALDVGSELGEVLSSSGAWVSFQASSIKFCGTVEFIMRVAACQTRGPAPS